MKSDFIVALTQLAAERGLPKESVLSAIEDALVSAYRKDTIADGQNITVKLDPGSGEVTVHILKTVVDEVINDKAEITLPDAREIVADVQLGDTITTESMPHNPGRIAAQTAKQVVMQRLRDAEREIVFKQFEDKEGEVFLVTLQKIDPHRITVDLDAPKPLCPRAEQVSTERYRSNTKMRVLLKSVARTLTGPELIVSRADNLLLKRLFEMEVPEIYSGAVEIEAIAREPGSRSKVAVRARQDGVRPGRVMRRAARRPHSEHRQRTARRKDRRRRMEQGSSHIRRQRSQSGASLEGRVEPGRRSGYGGSP